MRSVLEGQNKIIFILVEPIKIVIVNEKDGVSELNSLFRATKAIYSQFVANIFFKRSRSMLRDKSVRPAR